MGVLLYIHTFIFLFNALWCRALIRLFQFAEHVSVYTIGVHLFCTSEHFFNPQPFVLAFMFCSELPGCLFPWCFTLLPLRIVSRLCLPVYTAEAASFSGRFLFILRHYFLFLCASVRFSRHTAMQFSHLLLQLSSLMGSLWACVCQSGLSFELFSDYPLSFCSVSLCCLVFFVLVSIYSYVRVSLLFFSLLPFFFCTSPVFIPANERVYPCVGVCADLC